MKLRILKKKKKIFFFFFFFWNVKVWSNSKKNISLLYININKDKNKNFYDFHFHLIENELSESSIVIPLLSLLKLKILYLNLFVDN